MHTDLTRASSIMTAIEMYTCEPSEASHGLFRSCVSSRRYGIVVAFTLEPGEILIASMLGISLPVQALPRNLDIEEDILDQALFADVIVFGPYEAQYQEIHPCSVKILIEGMENVHFLPVRIQPPSLARNYFTVRPPQKKGARGFGLDRSRHTTDRTLLL